MKQVTAILLGAGHRGAIIYGQYALSHPDEIKFVAVAEPCDDRREAFASAHHIPAEYATASWEELLEKTLKQIVYLSVRMIEHIMSQPCLHWIRVIILLHDRMLCSF